MGKVNGSEFSPHSKLKFYQLAENLRTLIEEGHYTVGQRLPTEIEIADHFNLSRPTVAKALDLLRKEGLIERKSGVGTFVQKKTRSGAYNFGVLLMPGLCEAEFFEYLCKHMINLARDRHFNLVWSGSLKTDQTVPQKHTLQFAGRFVEEGVDGVFFKPSGLMSDKEISSEIVERFERAHIPVVLLDRDFVEFPARSQYDLVGVDNVRIGFTMTEHLLQQGCKHVKFVCLPDSPVYLRVFGYQQAMKNAHLPCLPRDIIEIDDFGPDSVTRLLEDARETGFFCANDTTASFLMRGLADMGYKIPEQVKIVGVDDMKYANYLHVPLTTYRQPCREIVAEAVELMLSRIADPEQQARTVYLNGELVARKSTQQV